jgi:hypothetical protein
VFAVYKVVSTTQGLLSLPVCRDVMPALFFIGMFCGFIFANCSDSFVSLMRQAASCPVTIVGLFAVLFLPFLLTAFAVLISCPAAVLLLAFGKAFLVGACSAACVLTFGGSGWLIRMLLLFSDFASIPVLYWLWLQCFSRENRCMIYSFLITFTALVVIGSIDFCVIAPFLASVI